MLSILIPSYYKADLLSYGLLSIQKQNLLIDYEILVLNDGIEDQTKKVCEKFPVLPIRYIFTGGRNYPSPKWRCPGFTLNIGVKQCKGELILLQQPEIWYLTYPCILDMIEEGSKDPKTVVSPFGYDDRGAHLKALQEGAEDIQVYATDPPFDHTLPFCTLMHKEQYVRMGGYDEELTGYCFDDNDFSERLKEDHCNFISLEHHQIIHLYHPRNPSYRVGLPNRNEAWQHNQELFLKKRGTVVRNLRQEWGKLND